MRKLRCGIYVRVSSDKQREKHTIEGQLDVLPPWVTSQGWEIVATYIDDGRSARAGQLHKRLDFARMRADINAGKLDVVAVVSFDRVTRTDDLDERGDILGMFQKARVLLAIYGQSEPIDLNTSHGDMQVTFLAWYAAEENRIRRKRAVLGRLKSAKRGTAAQRTPFGLAWSATDINNGFNGWRIVEDEAAPIRECAARMLKGESIASIGRDLDRRDVPAPATVRGYKNGKTTTCWAQALGQLMKRTTYRGEYHALKGKPPILVPPILDASTWLRCRELASASRKGSLDRTRHEYLCARIAVCARCGERLEVRSAEKRPEGRQDIAATYYCPRRRNRLGKYEEHERCDLPYIHTAQLDASVWAMVSQLVTEDGALERHLLHEGERAEDASRWAEDARKARARLADLDKARQQLIMQAAKGRVPEDLLESALAAQDQERKMHLGTIEAAGKQTVSVEDARAGIEALRATVAEHLDDMDAMPFADRRGLVRTVTVKLRVDEGRVIIDGVLPEPSVDIVRTSACPRTDDIHRETGKDPVRFRLIA